MIACKVHSGTFDKSCAWKKRKEEEKKHHSLILLFHAHVNENDHAVSNIYQWILQKSCCLRKEFADAVSF